eukprot:TRINITY_DN7415_c0_g5_i1.p1 TRINITY_DN7415_c0_g5~~TRINITY_DN7415_c0_g5_i1.p1  ORF type:complete len:627 (+),score=162.18 TRINITY_DN7415_c0_g5_i1:65-1945(+)
MCIRDRVVSDTSKAKRRLNFTSSVKEIDKTYFHAKIPTEVIKRGVWLNLSVDMVSFMELFKGHTFRSLELISICGTCKLRKVFTMKAPLIETGSDDEFIPPSAPNAVMVPKTLGFTAGTVFANQLLTAESVRRGVGNEGEFSQSNEIGSAGLKLGRLVSGKTTAMKVSQGPKREEMSTGEMMSPVDKTGGRNFHGLISPFSQASRRGVSTSGRQPPSIVFDTTHEERKGEDEQDLSNQRSSNKKRSTSQRMKIKSVSPRGPREVRGRKDEIIAKEMEEIAAKQAIKKATAPRPTRKTEVPKAAEEKSKKPPLDLKGRKPDQKKPEQAQGNTEKPEDLKTSKLSNVPSRKHPQSSQGNLREKQQLSEKRVKTTNDHLAVAREISDDEYNEMSNKFGSTFTRTNLFNTLKSGLGEEEIVYEGGFAEEDAEEIEENLEEDLRSQRSERRGNDSRIMDSRDTKRSVGDVIVSRTEQTVNSRISDGYRHYEEGEHHSDVRRHPLPNDSLEFDRVDRRAEVAEEAKKVTRPMNFLDNHISKMMQGFRPTTPPFNNVVRLESGTNATVITRKNDETVAIRNEFEEEMKEDTTTGREENQSEEKEDQMEVMYDSLLHCYYDPKTQAYYELKSKH